MNGITVKVDYGSRFEKIAGSDYGKLIDKSMTRSIVEAESICIREAPVKTETLRGSIGTSHPNFLTVCLTGVEYWRHVQFGTAPHVITPSHSKLLHWKDKTGEHFARKVQHPGSKANPFLTRTLQKIKSQNIFEQNFYDVLKSEGIIQ